jgi:CBS domain containing-hemolysin-like protein
MVGNPFEHVTAIDAEVVRKPRALAEAELRRLLRVARPLVLSFTAIFLPISLFLALLARGLRYLTGETPFQIRLGMARRDLEQVLREGHEAGILAGSQRGFAQSVFQIGNAPAVRFGVPPSRLASVDLHAGRDSAFAAARRCGHPIILVYSQQNLIGFVRYADLLYSPDHDVTPRPVVEASVAAKHLAVLLQMVDLGSDVAVLKQRNGEVHSVVTRRQLLQPLLAPPAA